jgi:ATP-dependent DNA helicase RecQ
MLRLNKVAWKDRGDMLHLLWFLFNTFSGRSQDKTLALKFWATNLAPVIADMPADAVNTQEIKFTGGNKKGAELAIFRLMLLGVVQDYTIEWAGFGGRFAVRVKRIAPAQVKESLRRYLSQYKFDDFAESAVDEMPLDSLAVCLEFAIDVLIDFIYDQIVTKRKQALRTMGELCRNFDSDQNFRDAILAYLQESEFSDQLRTWVNNDFDAIGLEQINELLAEVTTLEEAKRLVGTTRRMLDEDPGSVALRYVSMCARAQSITESDSSVVQEATALCIGIDDSREDIPDPDSLFVAMLEIIATRRASLLDEIADKSLRRAGTTSLARRLLATHLSEVDTIYRHSLVLLTSHALQNAKRTAFYSAQNREETNA